MSNKVIKLRVSETLVPRETYNNIVNMSNATRINSENAADSATSANASKTAAATSASQAASSASAAAASASAAASSATNLQQAVNNASASQQAATSAKDIVLTKLNEAQVYANDLKNQADLLLGSVDGAVNFPIEVGDDFTSLSDGVMLFDTDASVNRNALNAYKNPVIVVKDREGVVHNILPKTSAENVAGLTEALASAVADKVDKVSGKSLSTNDYTTAEKTKLSGIEAGAEVNVQSDWNAASTSDAYIKNKPTIPPEVTESTVSGWGFTKNTYSKPSGGIPETDLASAVQTKINQGGKDLISDAWSSATTYAVGDICIYNNKLWRCNVQHTGQTPSEGTYWTATTVGESLPFKLSINGEGNYGYLKADGSFIPFRGSAFDYSDCPVTKIEDPVYKCSSSVRSTATMIETYGMVQLLSSSAVGTYTLMDSLLNYKWIVIFGYYAGSSSATGDTSIYSAYSVYRADNIIGAKCWAGMLDDSSGYRSFVKFNSENSVTILNKKCGRIFGIA